MTLTATEINHAYDRQHDALHDLHLATLNEMERKRQLETRRAEILDSGEIDGKNAELREAQLKVRVHAELLNLDEAQAEVRRAEHSLRLAQLAVERCKTLLKLMDVTA